jgi:hypothetical protein
VALVDDDHVEEVGGEPVVVDDGGRLAESRGADVGRALLELLVEGLLALEDAVEALDRGDDDLVDGSILLWVRLTTL